MATDANRVKRLHRNANLGGKSTDTHASSLFSPGPRCRSTTSAPRPLQGRPRLSLHHLPWLRGIPGLLELRFLKSRSRKLNWTRHQSVNSEEQKIHIPPKRISITSIYVELQKVIFYKERAEGLSAPGVGHTYVRDDTESPTLYTSHFLLSKSLIKETSSASAWFSAQCCSVKATACKPRAQRAEGHSNEQSHPEEDSTSQSRLQPPAAASRLQTAVAIWECGSTLASLSSQKLQTQN